MKSDPFENIKKNFGFGCMRLPMTGGPSGPGPVPEDAEVDLEQFTQMVDEFMAAGFCYFDTAHGYLGGKSETAIRAALTSRYPRESYILTNKLTTFFFEREDQIRPVFEEQLQCCGVDYFDFYLMHAQNAAIYEKYRKCHAYETALELMAEGKFRHFGISFHDSAAVLEQILTDYPQIEVVQIQFNYADYDNPAVESRKCYEVCRKYGKDVIVMEPVKGGSLAVLPDEAAAVFAQCGGSPASYAIRFAAGFPGIRMVLSGMSDLAQLRENIGFMQNFRPLDEKEQAAVSKVCDIFLSMNAIPCTACRYCTALCPKNISIPDLFACMNMEKVHRNHMSHYYYEDVYTVRNGKASDCIGCGKCETACPQFLPIRQLLKEVAEEFEQQK